MEWRRAGGCGLVVGERVCGSPVFAPVACGQHARVLGAQRVSVIFWQRGTTHKLLREYMQRPPSSVGRAQGS